MAAVLPLQRDATLICFYLPSLEKTSPPLFVGDLLSIRVVSRRLAVVQLGLVLNLIRGRKVVQKVYGDTDRPQPLTPSRFLLFIFFLLDTHTRLHTSRIHGRRKRGNTPHM